ncbi:MAG TPA: AmmeMemoRadiSam system protein A [Terriglobia bacterium]|nr:AmmeMemoRadiSam system protein A [Terriglobia bacterium]
MPPLTEAEQRLLLILARRALEEKLLSQPWPDPPEIPPPLTERAGAFVTLHESGGLRGCIGQIEAVLPLYRTVRECALGAALCDPRFDPVRPEEIARLRIEISVLSPLRDSQPDEIETGRHGLMISLGSRRGLLLPQVAPKWGWDCTRFLQEACLKACLPQDAWRQGARVQTFTAQVFSEAGPEGGLASLHDSASEYRT